ncbi:UDP-N-acetylglucosamine 3-dehydrogenase [Candidatus Gugararchaeum adminiculabundum]|nr:UDP-N-acetylglucosamine 3-dehydrogenase [Candidatus Gugararchaeum adminiculabundum]
MEKIKVGIIGCGYWGRKHVDEYSKIPDAEIVGICDVASPDLEELAKKYGVKSFRKVRDLLDAGAQAVSIVTPNETHFEVAKECLCRGIHVLLEKPMTVTSAQAKELMAFADKKGLALKVGHIFRFNSAVNKTKQLVKEGHFGEVYIIKLTWSAIMNPTPRREVVFDLAPHAFDIINYVFGVYPFEITCVTGLMTRNELEDSAFILSKYRRGEDETHSVIEINWLNPQKTRNLEIIGSKRSAVVECVKQKIRVIENDGSVREVPVKENNTIADELTSFLNDTRKKKPDMEDAKVGYFNVIQLEAALNSAKLKKTMAVNFSQGV